MTQAQLPSPSGCWVQYMSETPVPQPAESNPPNVQPPAPRPRRYVAKATLVLLGINLALFIIETLAGGSTNMGVLLLLGASDSPLLRQGEYWRLVMPMFLHIGVLHLLVNGYALFIVGPVLEILYGYGRFVFIYVLAGIGGSALSMAASQNISAGASGAIFGIVGALLVVSLLHSDAIPPALARALRRNMILVIILNLLIPLVVPHIDIWAHLGGLFTGALLAGLIRPTVGQQWMASPEERPSQAIVAVPLVLVLLAMTATARQYRVDQKAFALLDEGATFQNQEQMDQAGDRFRQAVQVAPRNFQAHRLLASLYFQQGRVDDAKRELEIAQRLNPEAPETLLGLAGVYRKRHEENSVKLLLDRAFKGNPGTPETNVAFADECAAFQLYPEAIKLYTDAIGAKASNTTRAVAQNNLAWLYATSVDPQYRNPQAALDHAQEAVRLTNWRTAAFTDTLAEAFFALGNYDEAVKVEQITTDLEPNNPAYKAHLERYRMHGRV